MLTGQQTVVVAEIPVDLVLTAANVVKDAELGPSYAELLQLGLLDERTVVVMFLLIERLKGSRSRYAPWLHLLPTR